MLGMDQIHAFERQPYRRELEVEIVSVEPRAEAWMAVLDDTILYPEGGGQPCDRGWLEGVEVTQVERTDSGLLHVLEAAVAPGHGTLRLDWDRRYDHMQQHTAQHVITRTALDRFGWATRSFHIGPEVSDIELDCSPPPPEEIEGLEDSVAEAIVAARSIRSFRVGPEEYETLDVRSRGLPDGHRGDIRLVEIEDFDLNTCGGTHLASTAEIETVKIVGSESLRGGCRLFWVAGKRVRRRMAVQERHLASLRSLLDTGDAELAQGVATRLEQLKEAQRTRRTLEKELAEWIARDLARSDETVVELHLEGVEGALLRPIAEELACRGTFQAAFLTATLSDTTLFAVILGVDCRHDLQTVGSAVSQVLQGRGGGTGRVFQGKAATLARRSEAIGRLRQLMA